MKGYIIKRNKDYEVNYETRKLYTIPKGFDWRVFNTLQGIKRSLGSQQHMTRPKKNWKDRVKEQDIEIWEVEITPTKKVI
jgi:hypothetical protein